MIDEAIKKAFDYNATLSQREYDELLKYAKIYNSQGREACDAIATALANNSRPFRYVRRNEYEEKRLASIGRPRTSSGCFVTTACMQTLCENFSDDCHELTVLRSLRDQYVDKFYPDDVREYYINAPIIVEILNKRSDKKDVYEDIYQNMILPCVALCETNNLVESYKTYKDYYTELESRYLE